MEKKKKNMEKKKKKPKLQISTIYMAELTFGENTAFSCTHFYLLFHIYYYFKVHPNKILTCKVRGKRLNHLRWASS